MDIKDIKLKLTRLIPHIHNLPKVIYIYWLGRGWFIEKRWNRNSIGKYFVGAKVNGFREVIITNINIRFLNLIIFTLLKIEYRKDKKYERN